MKLSDLPGFLPIPWAQNAGPSFITAPLPLVSQIGIVDGRASWPDGFVPLNAQPIGSGGVPPFIGDTNAVLQAVSAAARWFQAGGRVSYSATFAAEIGGYPLGAILSSNTTGGVLWLNLSDNNSADPDAGGSPNWAPLASFMSGTANVTYTSASGTTTTTSTTFQSAGANLVMNKKRDSNLVFFVGMVAVKSDDSSSPNGINAGARIAQNATGPYLQIGNAVIGGTLVVGQTVKTRDTMVVMAMDDGTLPSGYNARVEFRSEDGSFVVEDYATLLAIEVWAL